MNFFSSWIISIIAVALLITLIEIILPNGAMQKFLKSIFGVFLVLVISSPIIELKNINISYSNEIETTSNDVIDYEMLEKINEKLAENLKKMIEISLNDAGFYNVFVDICYQKQSSVFEIKKITLDISNLVINTSVPHINKYTEMKSAITKILAIKESDIEINE